MDTPKTHPTMSVKDVFLLVAGALVLILLFLNIGAVKWRLFFWTVSVSKMLVVLILVGAGFGLGWWFARKRYRKQAPAAPPSAPSPSQPPPAGQQPKP